MNSITRKTATYTLVNLVISSPFMSIAFADQDKNETLAAKSKLTKASTIVILNDYKKEGDKKTSLTKHKLLAETQKQIIHEARDAVLEVRSALVELDKNNAKGALADLKVASKNLDIVLKKNPDMDLLPIDIQISIVDFDGDNAEIKKAIAEAGKLLNNGQLQRARKIFAVLASEMKTTTTSLPFGVLPAAIKKAIALIEENAHKNAEAADVLNDALNMLVETVDVMPLPILRAKGYISEASVLEPTQDLSKDKAKESILKLTDAARSQLERAELLAYGDKNDYQMLYKAIDKIKNKFTPAKK